MAKQVCTKVPYVGNGEGGTRGGRVFSRDPLEWHDVAGHGDATSGGTGVQIWARPATPRSVHPQLGLDHSLTLTGGSGGPRFTAPGLVP